jgi:hypothetical protein
MTADTTELLLADTARDDDPDPSRTAPLGWVYVLLYRRKRSELWREIFRDTSGERLWLRSLEMRMSGHYREAMVRTDLFDADVAARQDGEAQERR